MLGRAFDPERPVAASSEFDAGGEMIPAGAIFDWRARGLSQLDALAMFSAGLLVHSNDLVDVRMTPSERVAVETPAQASKRRRDRR